MADFGAVSSCADVSVHMNRCVCGEGVWLQGCVG